MKNFTDSTGKTYTCTLLSGKDNYEVWAYTMRNHFKTAGLEKYLTESKDCDGSEAQVAKSFLLSTLSEKATEEIIHCETPAEIWKYFDSAYGKKTSNLKLELINDLNSIRCDSAVDVPKAVTKVLTIRGKLNTLGVKLDDAVVIGAVIAFLPDTFQNFLDSWSMLDNEAQTLDKFLEKLSERSKKMVENEEQQAMVATRQKAYNPGSKERFAKPDFKAGSDNNNSDNVCHYCKKVGHWKSECRKLLFKRRQEEQPTTNIAFMALEQVSEVSTNQDIHKSVWIVDSGCSAHMTPNRQWMSNFRSFIKPVAIRLGNDSTIYARG